MIEQQSWVLNNSFGPISLRNYLWIFAKIVHSEHIVIFMLDLRKKNSIRKCKKLFTIVFLLISMRSFLFIISFVFSCLGAELKSGYPDYPKSGFTRTIFVTENRCPKSGYPNFRFLVE